MAVYAYRDEDPEHDKATEELGEAWFGYLEAQALLEQRQAEFRRLVERFPSPTRDQARWLYWATDEPEELVARWLECDPADVARLCQPGPKIPCSSCGSPASSRLADQLATGRSRERLTCEACKVTAADDPGDIWKEIYQSRVRVLRSMPYPKYLRTPEWQEVRQAALARAEHRCQVCDTSKRLHVHHRTYERRGCELPADVIVLCEVCHRRHHGIVT